MIEFCKNAQQVFTFVYTREAREILVQHCLCVESAVLWSVEQVESALRYSCHILDVSRNINHVSARGEYVSIG